MNSNVDGPALAPLEGMLQGVGNELVDNQTAGDGGVNAQTQIIGFHSDVDIRQHIRALQAGEKIQLVGFGSFQVKAKRARKGRNPQTGKPIKIPATKVVKFKPGKQLKDMVK